MKKTVIWLCVLLMILISGGCHSTAPISQDYYALDTIITLTLYDTQDESILQESWDFIDHLEGLLSRHIASSDIYRINTSRGQPVEVSDETVDVLTQSLAISDKCQGAFDITIGPVLFLWDFSAQSPKLPDKRALQKALTLVDYRKLVINGNQVTLPDGMALDLGSIAKGYITDQLAQFLQDKGVKTALLNLGGNIMTLGNKANGSAWNIGIRDPKGSANDALFSISLSGNESVVTSGIYERGFDLNGKRYFHLLDPKTGYPADTGLASVTIIAPSSTLADGLSTACFVLGADKGLALAREYGVQALFLFTDGSYQMTEGLQGKLTKLS